MAQQLPRTWMMCVLSKVGGGSGAGGGGRIMSMGGVSNVSVGAVTPIRRGFGNSARSQALLILSRSSTSSSLSSHRNLRLAGSSCERFRNGISRNFSDGFVVSGRGLRISRLPLLSPFPTRCLSSAEAQAVVDGIVKESLGKDAEEEENLVSSLAATVGEEEEEEVDSGLLAVTNEIVKEEVGAFLEEAASAAAVVEKEADEVGDRDTLIAEIRSKELELEELRSALRLVEERQGVAVESGVAPGFPEVDVSAEQAAAAHVSSALQESDDDYDSVAVAESEEYGVVAASKVEEEEDEVGSEENVESKSMAHPWPEWIEFLKRLEEARHFVNEENMVVDLNGSTNDDLGLIKRACLNFARERDDIFLHYSRKDLEVMARFGCPCTDRKVVNAGKRLRDFLAIDEISVCKPCALRSSCERRDFKANAEHVSGTPEVIRLLSQYALEVSPYAKEGLQIPAAVQTACKNLLKETTKLSAVPRDPSLPKIERKAEATTVRSDRRERESRRKVRDADVEMKPGDWKCEECQYVNFARNRTCRECDAFRPTPEIRPGDWRCPECNFVNFSRNQQCHDCKCDRPAGAGYKSSSERDRGRTYDRSSDMMTDRRSEGRRGDGRSRDFGGPERRSGSEEVRSGRRSNYEEWKPDLKRRGDSDEDEDEPPRTRRAVQDKKAALDLIGDYDDNGLDDFDLDSDDEDISDVEPLEDEEFEDMRPAASASRGRNDDWSRAGRRSEDKDTPWEDERSYRTERGERGDRGSRGGGDTGRGRGGGRGGRGGFGRDRSSSSRDSRPPPYERSDRDSGSSYGRSDRDSRPSSYERSDRDSGRSYGRSDRDSRPSSYERSDRDSGRSYGRSDRDSDRPSRGRGGGRGGGGRGGGRGAGGRGRGRR
ncbi:unnamed protein product [Calypogeia fissa]